MDKVKRTVARVEHGLIYLSSAIGNQTMAIELGLAATAQPGDVLEIVLENGTPKSATIQTHVHLNSNDN